MQHMYKPCGEYNPNPQAPHPQKRKEETLIIIIFFSPLNNFISIKRLNQWLKVSMISLQINSYPFALAIELQQLFWFNNIARRTKVSSTLGKSTKVALIYL